MGYVSGLLHSMYSSVLFSFSIHTHRYVFLLPNQSIPDYMEI